MPSSSSPKVGNPKALVAVDPRARKADDKRKLSPLRASKPELFHKTASGHFKAGPPPEPLTCDDAEFGMSDHELHDPAD